MFPDTLFLHGERGNVLALERFAKIAGLEPEVVKVELGTKSFDPSDYDVIFFGPGEVSSFPLLTEELAPVKDKLETFINEGKPVLVTGTTVGLFCSKVTRSSGEEFNGLGILRSEFKENEKVYGDDIYFKTEYNGMAMEIIGNQIQMGDIILKDEPFGELIYGYGNTGEDTKEGVVKGRSIFTNTLGPLLVCHPKLTAEIVKVAAKKAGLRIDETALDAFDDSLEIASFETKKDFIMTKETHLKNCRR